MEDIRDVSKGDFDTLLLIQREMLSENRRLRLLTVWLIGLTAVMLAATMVAVIVTV